jgi:L-serine dehydratase
MTDVTSMLGHRAINIATMQLHRSERGGHAVMVLECDQEIPDSAIRWLTRLEGILKVVYLSASGEAQAL